MLKLKWRRVWAYVRAQLWFRASLYSLAGLITATAAIFLKPYLPLDPEWSVKADSVDGILDILAGSMLTATTFTLGIMVSAYATASTTATPRATRLLISDTTTQNVVSTFVGAFIYAVVGIIALDLGIYDGSGRVILLAMTIAVTGLVVLTLLRWFHHLTTFGRLGDTTRRVEEAARYSILERRLRPHLGGLPPGPAADGRDFPFEVRAKEIGYLDTIDMDALQSLAETHDVRFSAKVLPGTYLGPNAVLARVSRELDDEANAAAVECFHISDIRNFDQDPRFGISALAEIASRALSPAVNDPGTAIDILGRLVRLLALWGDPTTTEAEPARFDRVHVAAITADDLFDDAFGPIARDGAALVEVVLRVQKSLSSLASVAHPDYRGVIARHMHETVERAEAGLAIGSDKKRVREFADAYFDAE